MFSIRHTHHRIASLSVFAYFFFNFCFQISEQFFGPTVSVLLEAAAAAAAAGISQEFIVLTSQVLKQQEQFFGPTVSVLLEAAAAAGISQEFIVLTSQVLKQQELKNIILSSCSFASAWVGVDGPFTTSFCCNGLIY
jgi:diaminopimelate decarboxylase